MFSAILSTWALLAGVALLMLGNGLQGTLLGVRASQESFDTLATGIIMTCYFAGFLLGSLFTPKVIRRVGHIRVFAAYASVASAAVLLHSIWVTPLVWALVRLLTGVCFAGLYVISESWLNDRATNETRGALLSAYMLVTLGSMICGQLLINTGDTQGFDLFIFASVLVSLAVVPIALTATPAPAFQEASSVSIRQMYQISPLGVVGIGLQGVANGALLSLAAVYAQQIGMTIAQTALFASAPLIGGFLMQWPIGRMSDQLDRRKVLTATAVLGAAVALGDSMLTSESTFQWQFIGAGLLGGVLLPQYSLCIAHTNDHLNPEQMMAGSSTLILVSGIGLAIGPTLAAASMSVFGDFALFATIGIMQAALAIFALFRMLARAPVPLEEQGAFVALNPRAGGIATQAALQASLEDEELAPE